MRSILLFVLTAIALPLRAESVAFVIRCFLLRAVAVRKAYRRGLWPRRRVLSVLEGADLELEPGEHSLQLLLGDYRHVPHEPPVISERITVIVE